MDTSKKPKKSAAKRLRIAQIWLFTIILFLTSMPYGVWYEKEKHKTLYATALNLIFGQDMRMDAPGNSGYVFSVFIIAPLIALIAAIFDKNHNIKNILGFVCSAIGIIWITYYIRSAIQIGALLTMFLYLVTCFLSALGFFATIQENMLKSDKIKEKVGPRIGD
ncbi:MAG: hypothetical protein Q8876_06565 [Bacillota bacterium]|nr:hypothetical protein [Bacillota bacterium]